MERIFKINLIQHSINDKEILIFDTIKYDKLLYKINNELKNIFYSSDSEILLEDYFKENYDKIADLSKFIIYSNLPIFNLNKEYNLNPQFIQKHKDRFIDAINLRLNDTINLKLNLIMKFNKTFYLDFKLSKNDCDEIFDVISRNYWFHKRENNVAKRIKIIK